MAASEGASGGEYVDEGQDRRGGKSVLKGWYDFLHHSVRRQPGAFGCKGRKISLEDAYPGNSRRPLLPPVARPSLKVCSLVDNIDDCTFFLFPGDTELFSKSLKIQSKRFYVDVKQNRRGKFIKIAEVSYETMNAFTGFAEGHLHVPSGSWFLPR